jgi:hypothetical protein
MVREMPDGTLKLTLSLATPVAKCKGGKLPSRWGRRTQDSGLLVARLADADGKLSTALRANDRCLVQGLDTDPRNVEKAREYLQSLGI